MAGIEAAITRVLLNPKLHDLLAIVKGARNGLVYGAKIRLPHAFVMTFLFGSGTPREKLEKILTAARQHAVRLCSYVAIYKTVLLVLKDLFHDGKPGSFDPFIAGMFGGWYMFGERTPVNEQVCRRPFVLNTRLCFIACHAVLPQHCLAPTCLKTGLHHDLSPFTMSCTKFLLL